MTKAEKLLKAVNNFDKISVLVLGDIMLDHYIHGKVSRISQEAPVPVVNVIKETSVLGGAGNVVHNVSTLKAKTLPVTVLGSDSVGRSIEKILRELKISTRGIVVDPERISTVKNRVVAQNQQLIRFDNEIKTKIPYLIEKTIINLITNLSKSVDAIIVSDYGKGVVTPKIMDEVRKQKRSVGAIVTVDPTTDSFPLYFGVTSITPNHHEVPVESRGTTLRQKLGLEALLVTQGKKGMTLFTEEESVGIPSVVKEVFDVSGAGDTVISVYTLGLASGLSMYESALLSNLAAGVVVGKPKVSAIKPSELKEAIYLSIKE